MISTLNTLNNRRLLVVLVILALCAMSVVAHAQSRQSLSVTPILIDMSAEKGKAWKSAIKVVNANPYELNVYVTPVNFSAEGESGESSFSPVIEDAEGGTTLAEWISIEKSPVRIAPESSVEIPFVIDVPKDASPGGHFAALLVGTQPPEGDGGQLVVRTAQVVTSLLFLRIDGDVVEDGRIRDFSVLDGFVDAPQAVFTLRFQNQGNVHIQPRGSITIYNMWGKERGTIPINQQSHFGKVLPGSIRAFEFTWTGESSISDIGRYKAVATVAFGDDPIQYDNRTTYFWVIPVKASLITLSLLAMFALFIQWAVRLYIRRMLILAGVNPESHEPRYQKSSFRTDSERQSKTVYVRSYKNIVAPVRAGIDEFKARVPSAPWGKGRMRALWEFIRSYKKFFIFLILICCAVIILVLFASDVRKEQKDYEVVIESGDREVVLNSDEVIFEQLLEDDSLTNDALKLNQEFDVEVVNTSGTPGSAGRLAFELVKQGYFVHAVSNEKDTVNEKTVIIYDVPIVDEAITLSKQLGGIQVSATPHSASSTEPRIVIYVGKDKAQ